LVKDVADIAAVIHVGTCGTDTDNVTGRGDVVARTKTRTHVVAAGSVIRKRILTDRDVKTASRILMQGFPTVGRVALSVVLKQRLINRWPCYR
jgi:hypothetical protein